MRGRCERPDESGLMGGVGNGARGDTRGLPRACPRPRCEMQPMIASDATALVWITLSSSLLGAMFAYAENRPHGIADFVNTELHGALAGGLNGASSLRSRFWCCGGAYGASLHQLPFLPYLARRSLLYLGIILLVLLASNLRVGITRADIAFSLTLSLGYNLLLGVNDLLGPGVLFAFVAGR